MPLKSIPEVERTNLLAAITETQSRVIQGEPNSGPPAQSNWPLEEAS